MKNTIHLRDAITKILPRQFMKLEQIQPCGTLELRKSGQGVLSFYWRVTFQDKTTRYKIGPYDSSSPPKSMTPTIKGFSLNAARATASGMAAKHYAALAEGGYESILATEQAEVAAKKEATVAAGYTLEKLLSMYVNVLSLKNKQTANQARNLFARNILKTFPDIADTQANKITTEQILTILRKLKSEGKHTTARKLKAYVRSAFEKAIEASHSADNPEEFKKFKIKQNPITGISVSSPSHGVDKNALLLDEMCTYWNAINIPGRNAAFLRLHLLLGGQRIEQLIKLKNKNVSEDFVVIFDKKGRTGKVREIVLPLIPAAAEALKEIQSNGEYAFSIIHGKHLGAATPNNWAKSIVGDKIDNFAIKRVRSGVITLLSKLKIDSEIRDHIQSHNLSGVEHRHYNMYDFMDEKKEALQKMYEFLSGKK